MAALANHHPEIRVNPALVRASEVRKPMGSTERLSGAIGVLQIVPLEDTRPLDAPA
ncbi:hypothetical protein [Burkholderia sola]|uniref:hypothetical protein n=1 Tax=Burkholderia sola TaxID=2843302 RepID=UPI001C0A8350